LAGGLPGVLVPGYWVKHPILYNADTIDFTSLLFMATSLKHLQAYSIDVGTGSSISQYSLYPIFSDVVFLITVFIGSLPFSIAQEINLWSRW
jgi:hypothetical protein